MRFKRGDSQIDWILAASIFVIFLSFFFILARPLFNTKSEADTTFNIIQDKVTEELFWTVDKIPLLVISDAYLNTYPLKTKITWTNQSNKVALCDNTSSFTDNHYFFTVKEINKSNSFLICYSNKTYEPGRELYHIRGNQNSLIAYDLNLTMKKSIPKKIFYKNSEKITDMRFYLPGIYVEPEQYNFTDGGIVGKYQFKYGYLNSTYYVYAGASAIDQRIDTRYDTVLEFKLHGYSHYFLDETYQANISQSFGCIERSTSSAVFNNPIEGLFLDFDRKTLVKLCIANDKTIDVNISFGHRNDTWIRYYFYDGSVNYSKIIKNVTYSFGIPISVEGLSEEKLAIFNKTDYGYLKQKWNYPEGKDFKITLVNSTTETGGKVPEINVYAKQIETYIIDKYTEKKPAKLAVQMW